MNDEPTKLPRSGSQYRGRAASTSTDRVLDDALGKGEKAVSILKKLLAFTGSGGTGSGLGLLLSDVLKVPGVQWWMVAVAMITLHLAVLLADVATKALRRLTNVGAKVEEALKQLAEVVKLMEAGRRVHESFETRLTALEGEAQARREEAEREELSAQAHARGITLHASMTLEEMRKAVRRTRSNGKIPSHRRPGTDETAVPPPTIDFEPLDPEA